MTFRIGLGRDLHRLVSGRRLLLCGVCVADEVGCDAHSDGDCAFHALMDSLLGAAALPNIGILFPDSAEENRGRDSGEMLRLVAERIWDAGFRVVNVDLVIQLESPKISSLMSQMRQNVASILEISESCVGLKATTAEGIGEVGASRAVEALSVCLLAG